MAVSTSIDFNETLTEIITDALSLIQVAGVGQTISSEDYSLSQRALNRMLKAWQAQGIYLFGQTEGVLVPAASTAQYAMSSASTSANVAVASDFFNTTLSAAEAAGQTVLSTTSTTNIAVSDKVGITLSDGTVQWTTLSSKTSTTMTVADALTGAASSGAYVYSFTTRMDRPVRILSARTYDPTSTNETPLTMLSREDYFSNTPNKLSTGSPTSFYYDPQMTTGQLYVWPVQSTITQIIKFTYQRQITDVDATTDNIDFPQEWLDAVVYSLAVRLGPFFGKHQEASALLPLASTFLSNAMDFDNETVSMTICPGN